MTIISNVSTHALADYSHNLIKLITKLYNNLQIVILGFAAQLSTNKIRGWCVWLPPATPLRLQEVLILWAWQERGQNWVKYNTFDFLFIYTYFVGLRTFK